MTILIYLLLIFIGFTIGRYSDKWGGHLNVPHHWIWGILIIFIGFFFKLWLVPIGIGLFISDLKDFIELRIWSPDKPKKWKFWDID